VRGGHGGAKLERGPIAVEQVGLRLGVQQRVVLVLSVYGDQRASQLAKLAWVGLAPVDPRGTTLAKLALEDERTATRVEDPLDRGALGAVTDLVIPAPGAEGEAQGVDDKRLATAGLAGQEI
jgi:hypothetical protein